MALWGLDWFCWCVVCVYVCVCVFVYIYICFKQLSNLRSFCREVALGLLHVLLHDVIVQESLQHDHAVQVPADLAESRSDGVGHPEVLG